MKKIPIIKASQNASKQLELKVLNSDFDFFAYSNLYNKPEDTRFIFDSDTEFEGTTDDKIVNCEFVLVDCRSNRLKCNLVRRKKHFEFECLALYGSTVNQTCWCFEYTPKTKTIKY